MEKEILEVLHKNVEVSLAIEQNVILEWDFEKVAKELNDLFVLRSVSRSIGLDTKPRLRAMTGEQLNRNINPCELCKYYDRFRDSEGCQKCINENDFGQYYG